MLLVDIFSIWIIAAAIFGLLFGSFLNVVIYRLPLMMERSWNRQARELLGLPLSSEDKESFSLASPPSHCPSCHAPVKPWSNIPLVSFLWQKGRCRHCSEPISWRYPLVELLTALAFVCCVWRLPIPWQLAGGLILTTVLIALIFIDAQTQLLPDNLTLPLLWIGLLFNTHNTFTHLNDAVLGAVIGYMSLWVLFQVFKLLTGKEGMGYGDFKLLAVLGAWFGVSVLPVIVLLSSIVGLVFALLLRVGKGKPMPFGPYLAISGWLVLLFQEPIMQWIDWWLMKSGFGV